VWRAGLGARDGFVTRSLWGVEGCVVSSTHPFLSCTDLLPSLEPTPHAWQVVMRLWSRVLGAQPGQRVQAGSKECSAAGGGAGEPGVRERGRLPCHTITSCTPPLLRSVFPHSRPPLPLPSSLPPSPCLTTLFTLSVARRPFLPSSRPPVLPSSLPPVLPSSLPPVLPSFRPAFLSSSLPPVLPSSLPSVMPSSRPPFLPSSLCPVLFPSIQSLAPPHPISSLPSNELAHSPPVTHARTLPSTDRSFSASVAYAFISPSLISPFLISPSLISPFLISPSLISPFLISPSLISPFLISPSLISPSLISPSLISPSHTSPSLISSSLISPSLISPFRLTPFRPTPFRHAILLLIPIPSFPHPSFPDPIIPSANFPIPPYGHTPSRDLPVTST
ncbi:unnamed protein product, partial [Closterium sp. Naga37s-1]